MPAYNDETAIKVNNAPTNYELVNGKTKEEDQYNALNVKAFTLPSEEVEVTGSGADVQLGKAMIAAWRSEGIFQVKIGGDQQMLGAIKECREQDQKFMGLPLAEKKAFAPQGNSYSGYIGAKEELMFGGKPNAMEFFYVTKDLSENDARVKANWPCHGPTQWPNADYKKAVTALMDSLGQYGG